MYLLLLVSLFAGVALGAECPPEGSPFFLIPHETDCSKFYICAHGVPVLQTCPDGTHFNPNHMVCQDPFFAGCDNTLPELCPDWSLLPRPYPDSCSKFYVCEYGSVTVFLCPEGLEFNAELLKCVWPHESNCSISQDISHETQSDVPQNDGVQNGGQSQDGCQDGDLSSHEDCSKYNVCSGGVQITMDCPAGLQWNTELSFCDWPVSAGCQK